MSGFLPDIYIIYSFVNFKFTYCACTSTYVRCPISRFLIFFIESDYTYYTSINIEYVS